MFHWTRARVFAAMAAGVPEVTALYNTAYERMVRKYGPSFGAAHERALDLVVIALVKREEALFEKNVTNMLMALGLGCCDLAGRQCDKCAALDARDDLNQQAMRDAMDADSMHGSASAYPAF